MDFNRYIQERQQWLEAALTRSIDDEAIPERLREAMKYSLEAGGKRLRPILTFAGAEAVGSSADAVMPVAVAIEMIHTFSLIHDDLPCMDDDSLRRGKPTNHKVYGEATAILAGDGLLAEAFYVLSEARTSLDPYLLIDTIHDIALATGGRGMTGGQVIDMQSTGKSISEAALMRLHRYKTGALIKTSVTSGARLCGASKEHLDALSRYGESVGLAFQIADDILDVEGKEDLIGKDVGSDKHKGKSTYPQVIGLDASRSQAEALVNQAVSAIRIFGDKAEPLKRIARYTIERNK
ncbi:MAG: polyprenyl synthetase family protein [Pseudomonadota bacterium]